LLPLSVKANWELSVQRELERQEQERVGVELRRQIAEEEKKVKDLESWVSNWTRARQMRDFIDALEIVWSRDGPANQLDEKASRQA
jgi:hypothetical protein